VLVKEFVQVEALFKLTLVKSGCRSGCCGLLSFHSLME
jgi:hypothetical protein